VIGTPGPSESPSPTPTGTKPPVLPPVPVAAGVPFSINTNLTNPSHLSAWAIDQWLAAHTVLPPLGSAFKRAETTYGVNAEYLVAHAMEETAFGSSYIAQAFNNLFGWNAIDSDPVGNATHFTSFEDSIDFVAERVATLYLSPTGAFYRGAPTLAGMSSYATGVDWAANIARIADQMETQLPTMHSLGVVLAPPAVGSWLTTATPTKVTLLAKNGAALPDGLHATYRFVPLIPVPGTVPSGIDPTAAPPFIDTGVTSSGGALTASVATPPTAGSYRLDVQLLDSDGTPLTEPGFQAVTSVGRIITAPASVEYGLRQVKNNLEFDVTNVGRLSVRAAADGQATAGQAATSASSSGAVLVAWLLGNDAEQPRELFQEPMLTDLAPGSTWTVTTPISAFDDGLPGTIVVRLLGAGDPTLLDGSMPGVFSVNPDTATGSPGAGVAVPGAPTALGILPAVAADLTSTSDDDTGANVQATGSAPASGAGGTKTAAAPPSIDVGVDPSGALDIRVANGTALFVPANPAPGTNPTALDGLMNGAAPPAPPSVQALVVPLLGPDTDPTVLDARLAAVPASPGDATAVLTLPAGAPGARQSIYFVVVRAVGQAGAPAAGADARAVWAGAPTTPAAPVPVTTDDPPVQINDVTTAP